jgi:predicted Zn-dependent peptidase
MPIATIDRSRLPVPGPVVPFAFSAIEKSVLPNGLRVWTVAHADVPVVAFVLVLGRGSADDPPEKDGLAATAADMLDEGAGELAAIDLHQELSRIGAQFETDINADATLLSLTTLSRFLDRGIALLADMIVRPALTEADFSRVRQLRLHRLTQLRDMPGAVADRAFVRLLYGEHPYAHTPLGSERTLSTMTIEDVRGFHARVMRPSAATLIAVGDCRHDAVYRLAAAAFGEWTGDAASDANPVPAPPEAPTLSIVPRPGAPQSELRIGHIAAARSTPDYHALVAANMVLGGQFVSRLNLNLRQDKGLTYGARSAFDFRRLPGPFSVQVSVHTAATAQAIAESLGEIAAIRGPRPASEGELATAVAALTRGFARNFETADQIARAMTQLAIYSLPDDFYTAFVPLMAQVTPADVTRAAAQHLDPGRLTTLVVGDLDLIGPDLAALNLGKPLVLSADSI